jgi:hypothetical protein
LENGTKNRGHGAEKIRNRCLGIVSCETIREQAMISRAGARGRNTEMARNATETHTKSSLFLAKTTLLSASFGVVQAVPSGM